MSDELKIGRIEFNDSLFRPRPKRGGPEPIPKLIPQEEVDYFIQQREMKNERHKLIMQFRHLLETLESDDIETAKEWLRAAIKLLEK